MTSNLFMIQLPANCNQIHTSQGILVNPGHQRRLTLSEGRFFLFIFEARSDPQCLDMKDCFKVLELLNQKNYNWKHPKGVFIQEGTFSEWQVLNTEWWIEPCSSVSSWFKNQSIIEFSWDSRTRAGVSPKVEWFSRKPLNLMWNWKFIYKDWTQKFIILKVICLNFAEAGKFKVFCKNMLEKVWILLRQANLVDRWHPVWWGELFLKFILFWIMWIFVLKSSPNFFWNQNIFFWTDL